MGKSGMMGGKGNAQQKQLAAQMRKNPNQVMNRLNQMDPRMLQQVSMRDVMTAIRVHCVVLQTNSFLVSPINRWAERRL